jgi:hypothetical protein
MTQDLGPAAIPEHEVTAMITGSIRPAGIMTMIAATDAAAVIADPV